ncbi:MAG: S-methyl-5'-thioadenosine phosphorylase [Thermoproteota archaeon]
MKKQVTADTAVIGGTGLEEWLQKTRTLRLGTPYGIVYPLYLGEIEDKKVLLLPRHGPQHSIPPHKINYRANIYALHQSGVTRILATNAVGAINLTFKLNNLVVPHDFVDLTKNRPITFYDESPVTHVDFSQPYCPQIRRQLIKTAEKLGFKVRDQAVMACTEGPRYETPAEIEMLRRLGCDVVGMTGIPEAVLARELEMCYSSLCYVSNMAAGIQEKLTVQEISEVSDNVLPKIEQMLINTIRTLPTERRCPCAVALRESRV